MKTFFVTEPAKASNTGPGNVDIQLLRHWPKDDEIAFIEKSGYARLREVVGKVLWSDCVLADSCGRMQKYAQWLCRLMGKRMVCIVHGWLPFENRVNELGLPETQLRDYERFMERCDRIAAVSKLQKAFIAEQAPNLADKIDWFFNGVERRKRIAHVDNGRFVVSVSGGTRPIKRNETVAAACSLIRERGLEVELRVYGRDYAGDKSWLSAPAIRYMGQVEQDRFLQGLAETDVFVMASLYESFGLSAIDALQAGASLLISDACGVNDTIALQDGDIVSNKATAEEIAEGILRLCRRPNAERLAASIDYERYSWDAAARRVRDICARSLS